MKNTAISNATQTTRFLSRRGLYFVVAYGILLVILMIWRAESCQGGLMFGLCQAIIDTTASLPWVLILERFYDLEYVIWPSIILNVIMFYFIGLGVDRWAAKHTRAWSI